MSRLLKTGTVCILYLTVGFFLSADEIENQIKDFPCYKLLDENKEVTKQFNEYMKWMSDLSPDGKAVYAMMQLKSKNIFLISQIFHEKVEFWQWMQLGNKFKDIMTVKYYQKKYPVVYPIAHRKAVIEEFNLIKQFALKNGFKNIPEAAYMLASPLSEYYGVPLDRAFRRFKFNWEYEAQVPFITKDEINTAIAVYEKGGYSFKDKEKVLNVAFAFTEKNKNKIMIPADGENPKIGGSK
jgi:hypothetical protein